IGRISTSGAITEWAVPGTSNNPRGITAGPDGALWFTETGSKKAGRLTTSGTFTQYALNSSAEPREIAVGADGALWISESGANKIGRIATDGTYTEIAIPTASAGPLGVALGSDNRIWFTENGAVRIGAINQSTSLSFTVSSNPVVYGQ